MQHAIDAIADVQAILERLDVDVGRAHVERVGDEEAHEPDDRSLGGQVLQLLHVGVEGEFVDARFDITDQLALRGLAAAVQTLECRIEFGRDGDHGPHGAPGHHFERADRVRIRRVDHRKRDLGLVLAQRQRACLAQEARGNALFEDRKFGVASDVDQWQFELCRQGFGHVALRHDAQRDEQRAQLFTGFLLQAQRALERRHVELAALDQQFTDAFSGRGVHVVSV